MEMSFGLWQEQTQKLIMTTQMKQAIEVLQCSAVELHEYIANEVEKNPVAEIEPLPAELLQTWSQRAGAAWFGGGRTYLPEDRQSLEQTVSARMNIYDAMEQQLRDCYAPETICRIAQYLIGSLDAKGYLTEADDVVAKRFGVELASVKEAVALLQSCEPAGIAARNLQECLLLQLTAVPERLRSLVEVCIHDHLEDIAGGRFTHIAKQIGTSLLVVQQAIDALRRLNPKPGLMYASEVPAYIIPDVTVEQVAGRFVVVTNDSAVPTVRISPSYLKLMQRYDGTTRQFLTKKVQGVEWLLRCIEQRRLTLYRVAEAIVEAQQAFFWKGAAGMKPLTLNKIADVLGIHESTVSRATRGKYMQTPRGVFEMRFFFTAVLQGDDGASSAQAAKHAIRQCVASEDATKPLSDEALVKHLADVGIRLSRRTVAKYRDELKILSSGQRRRFS